MSKQHTSGPWEVAYLDKHGQAVIRAEHFEVATCWHHSVGAIEKEMHANAHLIAVAPELLEMLSVSLELLRNVTPSGDALSDEVLKETIEVSAKVIAKAIGSEK